MSQEQFNSIIANLKLVKPQQPQITLPKVSPQTSTVITTSGCDCSNK